MYDVKTHLHEVKNQLPRDVRLVAISKYHPNEYIEAAYAEGQRIFGESHEQELRQKHEQLPKDIEWHFIGHLQTNKVKSTNKPRDATVLLKCYLNYISLRNPPNMV